MILNLSFNLSQIISFVFIFSATLSFAQELPKKLEQEKQLVDFHLVAGEYALVEETALALLGFYGNKTGDEVLLGKAEALFLKARAEVYLGASLDQFNKSIQEAESLLKSYKKDKELYIQSLIGFSYSLAEMGYTLEAAQTLERLTPLLSTSETDFRLEIEKVRILIDFKRGYYNNAFDKTIAILPQIEAEFVDTKKVYDKKKGAYVKVKLSKNEQITQKRIYANQLNFLTEILIEQGDYSTADSIIDVTTNWILSLIGKGDVAYVDNLYLKGLVAYHREKYPDALHYFEEAYFNLGKEKNGYYYLAPSEKYRRLVFKLLEVSAILNNEDYTTSYLNEYQGNVKRVFTNSHASRMYAYLIEVQIRIGRLDFAGASKFLQRINESDIQILGHIKEIEFLTTAYQVYFENNEIEKGLKALEKRELLIKKYHGIEHPVYILSALEKASAEAKHDSEFKPALDAFKQFYKIYTNEFTAEHAKFLYFTVDYSALLLQNNQYNEALAVLESGVTAMIAFHGNKSKQVGYVYTIMASHCLQWGDIQHTRTTLMKAQTIFNEEANKQCNEALDFNALMGNYLTLIGDYDGALKYYKKVSSSFSELEKNKKRKQRRAIDQSIFADFYLAKGKYSSIASELQSNLDLYKKTYGEKHRVTIEPLIVLLQLNLKTGDFTNATKHLHDLQEITKTIYGNQSLQFFNTLQYEATINTQLGDFEEAKKLLEKLIKKQETVYGSALNIHLAKSISELAMIKLLNSEKTPDVLNLFERSSNMIFESFNQKPTPLYANSLKNIATFHIESSENTKALVLIKKIETEVYKQLSIDQNHEKYAELHLLKGHIYNNQNSFALALAEFENASYKYKKTYSDIHPLYIECLSLIAQVHLAQNNNPKALETLEKTTTYYLKYVEDYFPWLTEHEKNMYWNKIKVDFDLYDAVALRMSKENPKIIENVFNYNIQTKAILLNSSVKLRRTIHESNDTTLIEEFDKWVSLREELTAILGISDEQLKSNGEKTKEELQAEIKLLEKHIAGKSTVFSNEISTKQTSKPTWQQVQSALNDNEYVVNIIRFRHFEKHFTDSIIYVALIISKQSKAPELVVLPRGNELENKYIHYYRNSMKLELEDTKTYDIFWAAIKNKVPDNAVVYFSNDGIYSQINLETLKKDKEFVLDKNHIVQIMNPRDLIGKSANVYSKPIAKGKAVFISNPTFYMTKKDGSIATLPGTELEIKNISKYLKDKGWDITNFSERSATETNVKNITTPHILHFATHGFFLQEVKKSETTFASGELSNRLNAINPLLKSGLLLANAGEIIESSDLLNLNEQEGILTAYETIGLNLINTEMVVLSACETGLGEIQTGEGVFGLQRSFIVAGAKILVMSLFKVDDNATQELMSKFYQYLTQGKTKREAFTLAKIDVRKKYPDPIDWGAFIMLGID